MMKFRVSLFAVALATVSASVHADEFAHIDPDVLARGIEKLAKAWSIPEAVFIGATDDFAKETSALTDPSPEALAFLTERAGEAGAYTEFEGSLNGLFTKEELDLVVGEIDRRRRLD